MAIKNAKRFAELERLMGDYFNAHIAPVMQSTKNELASKQADEMRDYSRSSAGILSFIASSQMPGGDPYQTLKVTGKWNSKTTEDYILMCKEKILNDKSMQKDLLLMASEWRNAVVKEIGRARYDALSQQLGCDLSYAFIEYRVEKQMIDKLVADNMPKSSAEYILRKTAKSSLFDLQRTLTQSPLAAEIEAKGEAAYKPKKWEKATGQVLGSATDAVTMGGAGSWASFAKFIGVDIAFSAATSAVQGKTKDALTVEDCISQGVFGSKTNVFNGFRKQAKAIKNYDDAYIKSTNEHLKKKICTTNFGTMDWTKNNTPQWSGGFKLPSAEREKKYKDVPLIVAPGKEEEYLKEKAKQDAEQKAKADKATKTEKPQNTTQSAENSEQQSQERSSTSLQTTDENQQQSEQTNENGWNGLLANFGLDGFGDITKNLGYILAMLPDMLVGLFTGKTKSLNMDNSLIPMASIVAGMFVKNPILKMLLIGMGGANLLNKAGHEALDNKKNEGVSVNNSTASQQTQYRQYPDEPLNPRITNPVLQGSCLVADIDHVPCTIQLPEAVVGAYQAGALPLNTLANAILAKTEQSRQLVANNYENEKERETISRTRGIQ
jgi:hypothetical protein